MKNTNNALLWYIFTISGDIIIILLCQQLLDDSNMEHTDLYIDRYRKDLTCFLVKQ